MILTGDIGGTHTRLALFEKGEKIDERKYPSREFASLEKIVEQYLQAEKRKVSKACFGIAGPVRNGKCKATNLPWVLDEAVLSQALKMPVRLLNDLVAHAYGLRRLKKDELHSLQSGDPKAQGNQALVSAGTGLGEAGLFWDGRKHLPFSCEGGHVDFAPRDDEEIALFHYLKKKNEHVSYERVVSGPGLYAIFQFLVETGRFPFSPEAKSEMEKRDPSKVVSEWGSKGQDPACKESLLRFVSVYGAEAGNVALKFMSLGGLYIGGGIAPHILKELKQGPFLTSFLSKGRFKGLLESIPIWIVLNDDTALIGAAVYMEDHD
jgi:glucokinase